MSGVIRCVCQLTQESKNAGVWPMNSPSAVKALSAAIAAPRVSVGRMIETIGNVRLRNMVGSGMIRLVWNPSPPNGGALRSGNDQPIGGVGQRRRIAGFVVPRLKVHCFGGPDTEQDSQHFRVGDPLSQRWIQAGAALLDKSKVEAGRVGDRLQMVRGTEVGVVSRNGWKLPVQISLGWLAGKCLRNRGFCVSLR